MAASKAKAATATDAFSAARDNPYVQRLIEDADLRDNVRVAFESARDAYGRLNNAKTPQKVLFDDKKFHRDVSRAADAMKSASSAFRERPKPKRSGGIGRLILIGVVGSVAALVASEGLRNKVLDLLFGAEEEFEYTSTTTPSPVSEPAGTAS